MLVNFDPLGICLHNGGIDLFSPPGSILPVFSVLGIDLLVPQDSFRGIKSHVIPAATQGAQSRYTSNLALPAKQEKD